MKKKKLPPEAYAHIKKSVKGLRTQSPAVASAVEEIFRDIVEILEKPKKRAPKKKAIEKKKA